MKQNNNHSFYYFNIFAASVVGWANQVLIRPVVVWIQLFRVFNLLDQPISSSSHFVLEQKV